MNASRSAWRMRPAGPLPRTPLRSTPASRARRRTAGLASALPPALCAGAETAGSGAGAEIDGTGGGATGAVAAAGAGAAAGSGEGSGSGSGAAFSAGSVAGESPSPSNSIRTAPTATISPTPPCSAVISPSCGEGIVTVALSVITSTKASSSATLSPTETCHCTTSPSTTPSPISGNLNTRFVIFIPPLLSLSRQRFLRD